MVLRPLFLQRKSRKYHPGNSHFTPFYAVCCPFHSLAASLRRFMPAASLRRFMPVFGLKVKRSSGKKEAREPLSRAYTVLCRFIFPNLTVVFGYVLYTVFIWFSPFFALKTVGFSAFFTRLFAHRVNNVRRLCTLGSTGIGAEDGVL
jgi:hypothetical protein